MRRSLLFLALLAACGCGRPTPPAPSGPPGVTPSSASPAPAPVREKLSPRRADMDDFFADWLKEHGHEDVVNDGDGVGVRGNATRLKAGLYGSDTGEKGGHSVEVEFAVRLPDGREVVDYVAGLGKTEDAAIRDALANFTLTTFHVLHRAFIDPSDSHVETSRVPIGGTDREVIVGNLYVRSARGLKLDLDRLRDSIQAALKSAPLGPGAHWIKVVYGQVGGRPVTFAVTVDNGEVPALTEAVRRIDWPRTDEFYMAKQVLVVE